VVGMVVFMVVFHTHDPRRRNVAKPKEGERYSTTRLPAAPTRCCVTSTANWSKGNRPFTSRPSLSRSTGLPNSVPPATRSAFPASSTTTKNSARAESLRYLPAERRLGSRRAELLLS
jgi:hypothetical protein